MRTFLRIDPLTVVLIAAAFYFAGRGVFGLGLAVLLSVVFVLTDYALIARMQANAATEHRRQLEEEA